MDLFCPGVMLGVENVQQIQAFGGAFAAILGDRSVVTWGCALEYEGEGGALQDRSENVRPIQATQQAFAAILGDGSIVTWSALKELQQIQASFGGFALQWICRAEELQQIHASDGAFAAVLGDGPIVCWGAAACDGERRNLQKFKPALYYTRNTRSVNS